MIEEYWGSIENIKPGDIIICPDIRWLLYVTQDLKLVFLTTDWQDFHHSVPVSLSSIVYDGAHGRGVNHLTDVRFRILGNIADIITLATGYDFNDRD